MVPVASLINNGNAYVPETFFAISFVYFVACFFIHSSPPNTCKTSPGAGAQWEFWAFGRECWSSLGGMRVKIGDKGGLMWSKRLRKGEAVPLPERGGTEG